MGNFKHIQHLKGKADCPLGGERTLNFWTPLNPISLVSSYSACPKAAPSVAIPETDSRQE